MPLSYNLKRSAALPHIVKADPLPEREAAEAGIDRQSLIGLQNRLAGRIVIPSFPDYGADKALSNPLWTSDPQIIVYCRTEADVVSALTYARETGLNIRMRSGGHSTAGYSAGPGMILDTSEMQGCSVVDTDTANPIAWVEPGCAFGQLNDTLDLYGLHVPGGGCPDVCPGGYMQGGGFGFTSRIFGMNCDNVAGVRMVLADGSAVVANEMENSDLYFAVRGGTGNNFGIITQIGYTLHKIEAKSSGAPLMFGYAFRWPLDTPQGRANAAKALALMEGEYMAGTKHARVGYMTVVCNQADLPDMSDSKPYLLFRAIAVPPLEHPDTDYLKPWKETGGELQYALWDSYNRLNYKLLAEPAEIPQFPPGTPMPFEDKHARYIDQCKTVGEPKWAEMMEFIVDRNPGGDRYCLVIEPYGGAINAVDELATAFVHRDVKMDIVMDSFWWKEEDRPATETFLAEWMDFIAPFWNNKIYQNYPHPDLANYRWNYWGHAFNSLLDVKRDRDPDYVFDFPQAIKPYPPDTTGLTVSDAPSIFK